MDPAAKLMLDYLRNVISRPDQADLSIEKLPEGLREFGTELQHFAEHVMENEKLAESLSRGELHVELPSRDNIMASPLKNLHATLMHLTWQARQVAMGDYQHRVVFMGEFASAFNTMAEQLERQRRELMEEIDAGRRKTRALKQSNGLLEAITRGISQWIIVMDGETFEWLFINRNAEDVLWDAGCESELQEWMIHQTSLIPGQVYSYCTELELPGGMGAQYFTVEVHPLDWYGHRAIAFVFTDISREKQHLYHLENAAYHDKLTQVYNRHYGMDILGNWLENRKTFSLCYVDMDHLKRVNDQFGHAVGDRYILAVTAALQNFSPEAVLCRLGGDEFMMLIEGWGEREICERMEILRKRLINDHSDTIHSSYLCNYSYGVVEVNSGNTMSAGDILSLADEKMYTYKRRHKAKLRKNGKRGAEKEYKETLRRAAEKDAE